MERALVEGENNQESSAMLNERQREEQAERVAIFEAGGKRKKRGRKRRLFGVAVCVQLVVVFFLPQLVGVFGKGLVESKASAALGADVRIEKLGLSWFGSQRVTGLRVVDSKLREAADLDIRAGKSLVGLLANWRSFGTVEVGGEVLLDQTEGPLAEILGGGSSEPAKTQSAGGVPMDLRGSVVLNGLDVRYRSDEVDLVAEGITGEFGIRGTDEMGITLRSPRFVYDGVANEVELTATLDGYADSEGMFDAEGAWLKGALGVSGERDLISLFAGDGVAHGRSDLTVEFEGAAGRGTAKLVHSAERSSVELPIAYERVGDAFVVEVTDGGSAAVGADVVRAYLPRVAEVVGQQIALESGRVVEVAQLPGLSLRVDELSAKVPLDGAFDLDSVVAGLTFETGELRGTLDGQGWVVEPMAVEVTTRGVRRGVRVQAVTTAQLGGQPAGVFVLNAEAEDVFGSVGAAEGDGFVERTLAGLRGGLEINDVETALVESVAGPMLASAGVVLSQDLGERVAAEVSLTGGSQQVARVWVTSDNFQIGGGFVYEDGVIRTDGSGVRAEAGSMAPLISRLADVPGLELTGGGGGELWVRDLDIDVAGLAAEGGIDWRAASGFVELRLDPMVGTILDQVESKEFRTSASAVSLDLLDIREGASVAGQISARVGGERAGELTVSLRARDLVDDSGALIGGLPTVEGEVSLRGVLARLAQPMVEASGFVLDEDIGPVVDVVARAGVNAEDVVTVDATVSAERVSGKAQLQIRDRVLSCVEDGVSFEVRRVGDLLARWLPEGLAPMQGGGVRVGSGDITIAIGDGGLDWSRSRFDAELEVLGVSVTDAEGRRYEIERLNGEIAMGSQADGSLTFNSVIKQRGEPVMAAGQFTFVGLVDEQRLALDEVRLDGRMDIGGFPISAATDVVDMGVRDVRSLTAELVGRLIDLSIAADAETGEVLIAVSGDRLSGEVLAAFAGGDLRVQHGRFESVIGPEVIEQIRLRTAQAAGQTAPVGARFIQPASVEFDVGGFGLLDGWSFVPTGSPEVKLMASGHVEGALLERAGLDVESGAVGLAPIAVEGVVPIGSVLGGEAAQASLIVSGELVSGDVHVAMVTGGVDLWFASGALHGPMSADLKLSELDCGQLDEIVHLDGLVAGVAGARLGADLAVVGEIESGSVSALTGELSVQSPRLRTHTPIRVAMDAESVWLTEPARVDWQIDQGTATHRLLAQPVGAERIYSVDPIDVALRVDSMTLSRSAGLFAPAVFELSAEVASSAVSVRVPAESGEPSEQMHRYEDVSLRVAGGSSVIKISGGAMPIDGRGEPVVVEIEITEFAGEDGVPRFAAATASVHVETKDSPSALFDALLNQRGLLAEVMGPLMSLDIRGEELRAESGLLHVDLVGTRATGNMVGRMFEGRFIVTEPAELVVSEVRPELGAYLGRAVPVIGAVTKSPEDGPARLTISTLEVPLVRDTQLTRVQDLVLEAVLNIGTARFQTSSAFSEVMKATGQRTQGGLGRRIDPISFEINSGTLTYPRTKLPIGEFTIATAGKYRLTDGYVDIVTYIPMAALTEEALGKLKTGVTSAIGRQFPGFEAATMVPWRTKGLPGARVVRADLELLLENLGDVFNPLNLLEQGLGSLGGLVIDSGDKDGGDEAGED